MRSSIVIDMAKRSRHNKKNHMAKKSRRNKKNLTYKYPEDDPIYKYLKDKFPEYDVYKIYEYPEDDPVYKYLEAFGKKPENLDEAYEKLAGHEELEIPANLRI